MTLTVGTAQSSSWSGHSWPFWLPAHALGSVQLTSSKTNFRTLGCLSGQFSQKSSLSQLVFLGSLLVSVWDKHKESGGSCATECHMWAISRARTLSPAVTGAGATQAGQQTLTGAGWCLGCLWHLCNTWTENWDLLISRLFHPGVMEKLLYEVLSHLALLQIRLELWSEIEGNKVTGDGIQGFPLLLLSLASLRESHRKRQ